VAYISPISGHKGNHKSKIAGGWGGWVGWVGWVGSWVVAEAVTDGGGRHAAARVAGQATTANQVVHPLTADA
jgi:hypothetical protein